MAVNAFGGTVSRMSAVEVDEWVHGPLFKMLPRVMTLVSGEYFAGDRGDQSLYDELLLAASGSH